MSRAKLLRNYNVSDWKRNTIAEMHSRNLVGEKRNLCLARALNTSPAMQSCCHKYLDEFHVPSDRILNRAWLRVGLKFRINYRLIIVRCRSTKLQFFLVVCIFFLLFVVWSSGDQIHVRERINKRSQISFMLKRRQRSDVSTWKRASSQTTVRTAIGLFRHWNTNNHI